MIVFRLCQSTYAMDLTGKGAEKAGGRWNSKGTAMIYTGETRALCTTEVAVHIPLGIIPRGYCLVEIEVPEKTLVYELPMKKLTDNWDTIPHPDNTQRIGDNFIREGKYLIMKVPSAVVQGEFNYLINPFHKDAGKLKIVKVSPFRFDERLFVR